MYLRQLNIDNVRSIYKMSLSFERGQEAGWHVILGQNGSGKSSVVRSLALLVMGEREAYASRQDFSKWIASDESSAEIRGEFAVDVEYDTLAGGGAPPKRTITCQVSLERTQGSFATTALANFSGERVQRTLWGGAPGWFCASFGPFRRFTGGDRVYDRLFVSNKRLAPHLTALGEDVALGEALSWLTSLHIQTLQDEKSSSPSLAGVTLQAVLDFINDSDFLPSEAFISAVDNEHVYVQDGNGNVVPVDQLSDGFRSALSMALELVRQMFELYGHEKMLRTLHNSGGIVNAPGVVAIDEVDAHLHPTWQREIGLWLTRVFPKVQFVVTTHSPIVCRAVAISANQLKGSVWKLPTPGTDEHFRKVQGEELGQLVYGDVLDAFSTQLFGSDITRSEAGKVLVERLAYLNQKALLTGLNSEEAAERRHLRRSLPLQAGKIGAASDVEV